MLAAMNAYVSAQDAGVAAARPNFDEMIDFCIDLLC
jgi:hypothetical protein